MGSDKKIKRFQSGLLAFFFINLIFIGCKGKGETGEPDPGITKVETPVDVVPSTGTVNERIKDSVYLYARQVYLWWDKLPSYEVFNPRKYSSLDAELYGITRYGINPATKLPYEFSPNSDGSDSREPKYSYISDITTQNPVAYIPARRSSVDLEGNGYDFGLLLGIFGKKDSYRVSIKAVYPGSPAAAAGFKRGDKITKINNKSFGTDYDNEINFINQALYNSSSVTLSGTTVTNASYSRSLSRQSYSSSPVYKDSVYTSGTKIIGYFAYGRFSDESNSNDKLAKVFTRFSQAGVTDLIVDFRYNGGGYVTTAEYLTNLIAPSSLNGKVMFKEYFNQLMQQKKATILQKQPLLNAFGDYQYVGGRLVTYADIDYSEKSRVTYFEKAGTLNSLKSVVFIVSNSTASASELVINSLKPYLNVKIVGSTTYGKPVGFYPIRINKYDVYLSMFETQNSKGEGGYYAGFTPDTGTSTFDDDDLDYDFGDLREDSFAAAYNYVTKETFTSQNKSAGAISAKKPAEIMDSGTRLFQSQEFKGMIQQPYKLLKR
jgi:carboxyl-terminal processing protease